MAINNISSADGLKELGVTVTFIDLKESDAFFAKYPIHDKSTLTRGTPGKDKIERERINSF